MILYWKVAVDQYSLMLLWIINFAIHIPIMNVQFQKLQKIDLLMPIAQKIRNVGTHAVAKTAGNVLLLYLTAKTNCQFGPLQPLSYPYLHSLESFGRY